MNLSTILALYPAAKIQSKKENEQYFSVPISNNQWLNIPLDKISKREEELLNIIFKEDNGQKTYTSLWSKYLEDHGEPPTFDGKIRFLFFSLKIKGTPVANWKNAIKNMFSSPILDFFAIDNNQFCLVEKLVPSSYNLQDFLGVIQTIDSDIDCSTKLFVGHPWSKENLSNFYREEKQIFKQELDKVIRSVFSFSTVALPYFTSHQLKKSQLIQYYKQEINKDTQLSHIITVLYKNQGNISLTAKDLYLHRNTLLYHIDKINKNLGLDLKKMDDLVLAYLATLK